MLNLISKFKIQLFLIALLLVGAVVMYFVASSFQKQEEEKRKLRLQAVHEDAILKIKSSVNNFAMLASGIGSFIKYNEKFPTDGELQVYTNHLIKDLQYKDSLVVSLIDTNHVFQYSFTKNLIDPQKLVGTSVRQFRDKVDISLLQYAMEKEIMVLFEPFNLVEGWPGIAMNFGIKRNGEKIGYVASIINLKHIVNSIYNGGNSKDFAFRFTTSKGFDFDREAVYDGKPIYNKNRDLQFYKNFDIDTNLFIYSNISVFDLNIRIGAVYKNASRADNYFVLFLYSWYFILFAFSTITVRQIYTAQRLNFKLRIANQQIEEKNKEITDSIEYAQNIQKAFLVSDEYLNTALAEHFLLFKPRDIVSGDFYWCYQSTEGKVIWTAVDCTGHGVPGAFMSMIGTGFLNEIIIENGITRADVILNKLREKIITALGQTGKLGEQKDGMDMALCVWDRQGDKLEFAGANNSLWLLRGNEIQEFKADRQPIGYFSDELKPFTKHEIQLQKGDLLYTFSDGYQDQFGGPKGKKFKAKMFKELLVSIKDKPMEKQKTIIDQKIEEWKGDLEQVDDICIIGVRI
ncbi:MAG: hypothetical protein COA57_09275 [Flavobacteriales bacterium]|nr:MAG: hypothetical protein COA57_09275 [Flavobacteriales bacterium]